MRYRQLTHIAARCAHTHSRGKWGTRNAASHDGPTTNRQIAHSDFAVSSRITTSQQEAILRRGSGIQPHRHAKAEQDDSDDGSSRSLRLRHAETASQSGYLCCVPALILNHRCQAMIDPEALKEVQANQAEMHKNLQNVQNLEFSGGSLGKLLAGSTEKASAPTSPGGPQRRRKAA